MKFALMFQLQTPKPLDAEDTAQAREAAAAAEARSLAGSPRMV